MIDTRAVAAYRARAVAAAGCRCGQYVCIPSLINPPVLARNDDDDDGSGDGDDDRHATNKSGASTTTSTTLARPPVIYRSRRTAGTAGAGERTRS